MTHSAFPLTDTAGKPFGTFGLPPSRERFRALIAHVPPGRYMRHAASLLRRLALAGWKGPIDFEPYPATRVRLYPRENISDKHCLMHPAAWDGVERGAILDHLRGASRATRVFVDVGANVGLYALSALSDARRSGHGLRVLAIEPEPVNLSRLRFNIRASGADDAVHVAPCAVGDRHGVARLSVTVRNRGDTRVSDDGEVEVKIAPLADIVAQAGLDHIDAMKLDIEGFEPIVLAHFFAHAPVSLHPGLIVAEIRFDAEARVAALCASAGYATLRNDGVNAIFAKRHSGTGA